MDLVVGNKPIKKYLMTALVTVQKEPKLVIKARGKGITKAIDLTEVVKRKLPEVVVKSIAINTTTVASRETQRPLRLSTIEITLVMNREKV